MIKIIEAVILIFALQKIAAILFVPVLLGIIFGKGKISKMNTEQWESYLRGMSNRRFVIIFFISYSIALLSVSAGGYFLYDLLGLTDPLILAGLTFLFGILNVVRKLDDNKKELWKKIKTFG